MIPTFQISVDGKNIRKNIKDRLISLTVKDEAGWRSDEVSLSIADHQENIALPRMGAEMTLALGYDEKVEEMGIYVVDKIDLKGPPSVINICARAANFIETLKASKSRSWDQVTVYDLVSAIAAQHNLDPVVDAHLKNTRFDHIDQTEESDLNFLTRIASEMNATTKPVHKKLLFIPAGQARSASGKPLPEIVLKKSQVTSYTVLFENRMKYKSVSSQWHNHEGADVQSIEIGEGDPKFTMRHTYVSEEKARVAAQAKFDKLKRGTKTLKISLPGNAKIHAEAPLNTTGFREGANERWIIKSVSHTLSKEGFKTDLEAEQTQILWPI